MDSRLYGTDGLALLCSDILMRPMLKVVELQNARKMPGQARQDPIDGVPTLFKTGMFRPLADILLKFRIERCEPLPFLYALLVSRKRGIHENTISP